MISLSLEDWALVTLEGRRRADGLVATSRYSMLDASKRSWRLRSRMCWGARFMTGRVMHSASAPTRNVP